MMSNILNVGIPCGKVAFAVVFHRSVAQAVEPWAINQFLAAIADNNELKLEVLREEFPELIFKAYYEALRRNIRIGAQGAEHMAAALRENKTLTTLHMGSNYIGAQGKALLSKHGDRVKF